MNKYVQADIILDVLMRRQFDKWYTNRFLDFLEGVDESSVNKGDILEDIIKLFKLR